MVPAIRAQKQYAIDINIRYLEAFLNGIGAYIYLVL